EAEVAHANDRAVSSLWQEGQGPGRISRPDCPLSELQREVQDRRLRRWFRLRRWRPCAGGKSYSPFVRATGGPEPTHPARAGDQPARSNRAVSGAGRARSGKLWGRVPGVRPAARTRGRPQGAACRHSGKSPGGRTLLARGEGGSPAAPSAYRAGI